MGLDLLENRFIVELCKQTIRNLGFTSVKGNMIRDPRSLNTLLRFSYVNDETRRYLVLSVGDSVGMDYEECRLFMESMEKKIVAYLEKEVRCDRRLYPPK